MTRLRSVYLRVCSGLAMVAPTMAMRVRFNRWKGVTMGRDPWMGIMAFLDIHHSHPDRRNAITIGDGVAVGHHVYLYSHDSLYNRVSEGRLPVVFGKVVIGDHVNLSTGAMVCNSTIGSHSIVAPYAVVVNSEFPPYSLIAGNPAKVVKDIRDRVEGA